MIRQRTKRTDVRLMLTVAFAMVGMVAARMLGSLLQLILARYMSIEEFGTYITLFTLLGPVVMVTSLGLDTWLLRFKESTKTLEYVIGQVFGIRLIATAALMLPVIAVLFFAGRLDRAAPALLAAGALTMELLLTTAHTALRSQHRNHAATMLQIIVAGLTIALIIGLWNERFPLLSATGYRLLADVIGVALICVLLRHSLRTIVWRVSAMVPIIRQALAYFVSDLLATVALKADLTLIALLIGAIGAATYGPALTIINTTFLVPTVVWQVVLPIMSKLAHTSQAYQRMIWHLFAGAVVFGIACFVVLFWQTDLIIRTLFTAQYLEAAPLIRIMSIIPLLKSINFCWAMIMVAGDRQRLRTMLLSVAAVFNVGCNLLAIPFFGLVGAAWINVMTEIILVCCYGYGALKTLHSS